MKTNSLLFTLLTVVGSSALAQVTLQNGVAVRNLSGSQGAQAFFAIAVPAGASNLTFTITGANGDADLYTRFGVRPTASAFDCRPYTTISNETCRVAAPLVGTYWVMLDGYEAYSGVTLVARFTVRTDGGTVDGGRPDGGVDGGGTGDGGADGGIDGGGSADGGRPDGGLDGGGTVDGGADGGVDGGGTVDGGSDGGVDAGATVDGGSDGGITDGGMGDPGVMGGLAVTRSEYDQGATALNLTGFPRPVEMTGSVHYPTGLSGGPFPVVIFLHGRHSTCYQGTSTFLEWPCSGTHSPIPSYRGYDYLAEVLASHGYIVVSISANGVNAADNQVADLGMNARAQLVQRHLDFWATQNSTGSAPFGTQFIGKVDLTRVGTMGHSRGGEGVTGHYLLNIAEGNRYGVKAVLPLAPVNFSRKTIDRVPLEVILPYCDGDVSDLQGVHFFDDARYSAPGDPARKHYVLVMGANHNFFNTIWTPGSFPAGAADDWDSWGSASDPHCGSRNPFRLTAAKQRAVALAYVTAFFRTYVGDESRFLPILTGEQAPPPSAEGADLLVSHHAPSGTDHRLDVNRLFQPADLTTNTAGGSVVVTGLTPAPALCGGASPLPPACLIGQASARQPHTAPAHLSPAAGLSQARLTWIQGGGSFQNDLPLGVRNISRFAALQVRIGVDFTDTKNTGGTDLELVLTDGRGVSSSARASNFTTALRFPPGSQGAVPKLMLNTLRVPLTAFTGLDLTDMRSVQLRMSQRATGSVLIADLGFSD